MYAIVGQSLAAMDALFECGAACGRSVVQDAMHNGANASVIARILAYNPDSVLYTDALRNTLLHYAVDNKDIMSVDLLCALGADVAAADIEGQSPRLLAVGWAEGAAKLDEYSRVRESDRLIMCLESEPSVAVGIVQHDGAGALVLNGENNILHYASKAGRAELVEALLLPYSDMCGQRLTVPLHWAARWNQVECVRLLLKNKCARDSTGRIPLHYALGAGAVDAAAILIDASDVVDVTCLTFLYHLR